MPSRRCAGNGSDSKVPRGTANITCTLGLYKMQIGSQTPCPTRCPCCPGKETTRRQLPEVLFVGLVPADDLVGFVEINLRTPRWCHRDLSLKTSCKTELRAESRPWRTKHIAQRNHRLPWVEVEARIRRDTKVQSPGKNCCARQKLEKACVGCKRRGRGRSGWRLRKYSPEPRFSAHPTFKETPNSRVQLATAAPESASYLARGFPFRTNNK